MSANRFYDTNILVYAYDEDEAEKRSACEKLVEDVFAGRVRGVVSNQVLGELFHILTSRVEKPLSKNLANRILSKYVKSDNWIKINYASSTVLSAGISAELSNTQFWDTLIAETMKENSVLEIITENDKDFSRIPGIKIVNPFKTL